MPLGRFAGLLMWLWGRGVCAGGTFFGMCRGHGVWVAVVVWRHQILFNPEWI